MNFPHTQSIYNFFKIIDKPKILSDLSYEHSSTSSFGQVWEKEAIEILE